jgi:hypothetical protein
MVHMTTAETTAKAVVVTAENFKRAESDLYFGNLVNDGAFGRFHHERVPAAIDRQQVVRLNRDTLYSTGIFDLDAGPVTVTLPDAGARFRSMMVLNQDHYVQDVVYSAGAHTYTRERIGTRYVLLALRTLVNPADSRDLEQVHALQDAVTVAPRSAGSFEVPGWDPASQKVVRDALKALGTTLQDWKNTFGSKDDVDPVRHLIGTAVGWGGNPEKDAIYLGVMPARNDGTTIHRLKVKDVPVDGFWSVTVYNADGFFEKNSRNAYSFNNLTAKKDSDGSITIQFGGCDGATANCLPIMKGWNYTVRLYRPRAEILDGRWTFPEAVPVG